MFLDAKLDARPWTWWLAAARAQFWHLGRMILVAGSCGEANLVCLVTMIDGACVETMVSKGWSGSGRFCCKSYNNFLISAPAHPPSCVVYAINQAHSSSQLLQLLWCCCIIVHQKKKHQEAPKFMQVDTESVLLCREMIILHVCSFNTDAGKKKTMEQNGTMGSSGSASPQTSAFYECFCIFKRIKGLPFYQEPAGHSWKSSKINNLGSLLQIKLI